jgi:hypothetical protein
MDVCERDYPEYVGYLNRQFGNRTATVDDLDREPGLGQSPFAPDGLGRLGLTLKANESGGVTMQMTQKPRGEPIKLNGLLTLMQGVVDRHPDLLREELLAAGGHVTLFWRYMGGDCPETRRTEGLPLHGWSSDWSHTDVAMPDFTFTEYKDIRSKDVNPDWTSNGWKDVQERLHKIKKTKRGFVYRGSMSNKARQQLGEMANSPPPERLKDLLAEVAPDGFDVSMMQHAGSKKENFLSIYDQCEYAYTFHVAGKHYSANLKYKLACNQTVFMIGRKAYLKEEFWYEALRYGKNLFFIKEDFSNFWDVIEEALRPQDGLPAGKRAEIVAKQGRELADTYLSERGIDCYVNMYLTEYYIPLWSRARYIHGDPLMNSTLQMRLDDSARSFEAMQTAGECMAPGRTEPLQLSQQ